MKKLLVGCSTAYIALLTVSIICAYVPYLILLLSPPIIYFAVLILISIVWNQLNSRVHIKIAKKELSILLASSIVVGLYTDVFLFRVTEYPLWKALNFTFSVPLSLILLITAVHIIKVKNNNYIIPSSIVLMFACMIFTFWFYALKAGPSGFYALVYIIGALPSLSVGAVYGLRIYLSIKNSTESNDANHPTSLRDRLTKKI
jgi:hypothetical protein